MNTMEKTCLKVLMLPWLAHGHISPFLELAKRLTKRKIFVYLCSTPINLLSTTKKLTPPYSQSIELVEIHLPTLPNLPPHYHTTNGLPPHLMGTLKEAFEMAKPELANILEELKPDFFIHDILVMWAGEVASSVGVPSFDFLTAGATMAAFFMDMMAHPDARFPFPAIYLHEYEKARFFSLIEEESKVDFDKVKPGNINLRLIKSFKEIEGKYIDYYAGITKRELLPVGPLVEDPLDEDDSLDVIQWLDKKDKGSTVFVSFGSEYFLTNEEMEEIAHGLELSQVNFMWVVRFLKERQGIKVEEALPKGFLERIGQRGKIVNGWAPQVTILRHKSIGGFVSHCGWASVLESMKFGVPIIAMPMHLDQPLNARLVVEVGVGKEVIREPKSGRLDRATVAKTVREVVMEKGGESVRTRAREVSQKLKLKGEEEIDVLVEKMLQIYKGRKEVM